MGALGAVIVVGQSFHAVRVRLRQMRGGSRRISSWADGPVMTRRRVARAEPGSMYGRHGRDAGNGRVSMCSVCSGRCSACEGRAGRSVCGLSKHTALSGEAGWSGEGARTRLPLWDCGKGEASKA